MTSYRIDARGLRWPEPLFHLEEQVRRLGARDMIELLATDRDVEEELPIWCRSHGHYLLDLEHRDGEIHAFLEIGE